MNVSQCHQQICVILDRLASEPILIEMTHPLILLIEVPHIGDADSLQNDLKRFSRPGLHVFSLYRYHRRAHGFLDQQMHVIPHQAIPIQRKTAPLSVDLQQLQVFLLILVILKDSLIVDPPDHYVVHA